MTLLNNLLSALPFLDQQQASMLIDAFLPMLRGAIVNTIPLTLLSFLFGMILAVFIALIRVVPRTNPLYALGYYLARVYVSAIRGTPLLVQLFIIFYGLPNIGVKLDPFPSAVIAFSLNIGAYASETLRAAILSIPKGQWEASYSIGMSYAQTFRRTIMPQAMRVSVPPLSNSFISLVKDTSLASTVLVTELLREAQNIAATTYEFLWIYSEAALIYWIICFSLSLLQGRLEKHFSRYG
ncbi:amino acid ABC transporter permease [Testudinibacter sp. TR-2022]|uniref:amino acid ABC transporter permease n=1 Tax=Testudinibacter sp. TR-2022 TaxID=2585029 RepID=UPI0011191E20|nr:amino acid ABC transporter permease [Testudinibacter sp. TR-2022]TNH05170.1 amino acid ABC transporter permease [Pasteurellaceae bacterium Phil31]TNH07377.1 amino acid ABC transporter permease [Testudinibacter sp. TR-2022]TNH08419.1 amino acid ABC transporter permease [Testudinibacter sp. TR-2022]TNH13007.1 amino acid ABC transporter permease [Testudinibacter sp. TR-2022]TNH15044.1 amino acid ABC transporter permease [Testudinibacter sp. TR-2022]